MNKIMNKIRKIREKKVYSQEYMQEKLNMSQAAYSNLEANKTKLTVEKLLEISEILEVPVESLIQDDTKNNFTITNNDNGLGEYIFEDYIRNRKKTVR